MRDVLGSCCLATVSSMLSNLPHIRVYTARKKIQRVEIMTSPSVDLFTIFILISQPS